MGLPKVNIILINYGTPDDTIECLESIRLNTYTEFRVVIVDVQNINSSKGKISRWISTKGDMRFVLIEEEKNNGFSFANNVGIKYALKQNDASFFWILNNDTIIEPDTLEELIKCYNRNKENKKIGFVGSKTKDYYHREIIENIGGRFNKWTGYSVLQANGKNDSDQFRDKILTVDYVVGASMFFHKSLLNAIGLMPEEYFLYYEDIDWSLTAKKRGFENKTCLNSIVFHKQGVSTGTKLSSYNTNLEIKKHLYLSFLVLYKKHFRKQLPVVYFILAKMWAGRIYHNQLKEAKLIMGVMFNRVRK